MGTKQSSKRADAPAEAEHRHRPQKPKAKPLKRKEDNISWVRKRARDIERRLQRDDSKLPANVLNDLERELAAHRSRLAGEQAKKLRSKMISKYHMVRFFERKKATRLAKRLRKQLAEESDPATVASLKANLHVAEVDVNYAMYCPLMEPYVSMYPAAVEKAEKPDQKQNEKTDDHGIAQLALDIERPPLWKTVEKAMEEGQEALQMLRDRRPDADTEEGGQVSRPTSKQTQKAKTATNRNRAGDGAVSRGSTGSRGNRQAGTELGRESDSDGGGFFEEG